MEEEGIKMTSFNGTILHRLKGQLQVKNYNFRADRVSGVYSHGESPTSKFGREPHQNEGWKKAEYLGGRAAAMWRHLCQATKQGPRTRRGYHWLLSLFKWGEAREDGEKEDSFFFKFSSIRSFLKKVVGSIVQ